mgnify:FL=1
MPMRLFSTLLFCLSLSPALLAQPVLKPGIGLGAEPNDSDPVCSIPLYLGNFDASGLHAGDTAYDFTLYRLDGAAFTLSEALNAGKPVLLVAGNYTCPVFRNKLPVLNQLVAQYGNAVTIAVVYGVEAHPDIDISPYFGYVNTGQANKNAGILYRQPTTYGERKVVAADKLAALDINPPVYVDDHCKA